MWGWSTRSNSTCLTLFRRHYLYGTRVRESSGLTRAFAGLSIAIAVIWKLCLPDFSQQRLLLPIPYNMACCVLTAYCMQKIIQSLELFDIKLIEIKYNDFDDFASGPVTATQITVTKFAVDGMTCAACTSAIRDAVKKVEGIHSVSVSLPLGEASVTYDASRVQVTEIEQTIKDAGYFAESSSRSPEARAEQLSYSGELSKLRTSVNQATILASVIAAIEMASKLVTDASLFFHVSTLLGLWIILQNAAFIHKCAWQSLKARHLTMDTLTSLSLLLSASMTICYFQLYSIDRARNYASSGAYLATVILCGRYIDLLLRRKSAANFTSLYRLQNETATVFSTTKDAKVPAILLEPQDEIILEAQDIVPVDCYILKGLSLVDQAVITGESRPISKTIGDRILAGTRNLSGRVTAIVINDQEHSSLAQLVDSITLSLETATEVDNVMSSITKHFVTIVLLVAISSLLLTYARHDPYQSSRSELIEKACERVMAILASACPCTLGLAGPAAVMAGIDAAWHCGVMVTNPVQTFACLTRLTHIVMDKTGTLTEGKLQVTSMTRVQDSALSEAGIFMSLCAVERDVMQDHPVASAIFGYALRALSEETRSEQNEVAIRSRETGATNGVACEVMLPGTSQWRSVACGSAKFVSQYCKDPAFEWKTGRQANSTEAYVCVDGHLTAHITLHDAIRKEAALVVNELHNSGLQVSMLTGDVDEEAERVCLNLGIPLLAARSLDKKQHVEVLQRKGQVVAMLGDGFNDLAAQAQADVGIHLKLPGSTSASASTAQVLLSSPNLSHLTTLLQIAQMTMRQSRFNMIWALAYNAIAITLALGVGERWGMSVSAATAGSMMAFSSAIVTVLSLHLRYRLGQITSL